MSFLDFLNNDPEHVADMARRKAENEAAMRERREGLIARYASEEAVLAPGPKERLLLAAVAAAGGCDRFDPWNPAPEPTEGAIRAAYPLPTTCVEAAAEHKYWSERNDDICAMHGMWGEQALDPLPARRLEIVTALLERELVPRTLADMRARVAYLASLGRMWDEREQRLVVDGLENVAASVQADGSPQSSPSGQIAAALKADPSRSDRSVARALKCSPTTVGRVRKSLGLGGALRSVQRRGQVFQARFGGRART